MHVNKLFLHIGLSKTGSSAIQSWLSANSEALAEFDVSYADLYPDAKLDKISPGNGEHIVRFLRLKGRQEMPDRRLVREIRRTYFDGMPTAIVSAEAMTNAGAAGIRRLKHVLEELDLEVIVIAYVRSIYDHFWSGYQQLIKRSGYHDGPAEFAATYPNVQVNALRRWSTYFPDMRVINYDTVKDSLIESFAGACELELPAGVETGVARINRSLSAAERALLIDVNRQAEERGLEFRALLSDALVYASPETESAFVYDPEVLKLLRNSFEDDVAWVNENLLPDDPITIEPTAEVDGTALPGGEPEVAPEVSAVIGALLDQIVEPAPFVKGKGEEPSERPQGSDGRGASAKRRKANLS